MVWKKWIERKSFGILLTRCNGCVDLTLLDSMICAAVFLDVRQGALEFTLAYQLKS